MKSRWLIRVLAAAFCIQFTLTAAAEALPSLSMMGLIYRMSKDRVTDEALKQQMEPVDVRLREAYTSGRISEARRAIAEGLSLANGRGWSDQQDFAASLVVRTDEAFVDPSHPVTVRLEQIFPSRLVRTSRVVARVALHEAGTGGPRGLPQVGKKLQDLGELPEVSLDLIESPLVKQVDLRDVKDGDYDLRFELLDGTESLGSAGTRLRVRAGLDQRILALRQQSNKASPELRPDILYPLDFMRKINTGLVQAGGFDVDAELAAAEAIGATVAKGTDPFKNRTGDFERHYVLAEADEIMPYRVYVPSDYPKRGQYPLIVALHGLGGNEDSMVSDFYGMIPQAEQRGYIIVSPMGFRPDGGYGRGGPGASRATDLSEKDVLQVLQRMQASYAIDSQRIYLMGHSMGAIGTWNLAAKHPQIWAGLGPIAGMADPATAGTIAHIAQIVVHGDADLTVPVAGSRRMVEALQKLEADVKYIEVPGGGHSDIAPPNMSAIFDFFDAHKRSGV